MRQAGVGLLAAAVLAGSAQAATITSSTEQITLDADQETFTLVVSMEESDPFAGAEFGIDLPDGVELTEVEFLSDLGSVSHVETQRESRYYFGFYDTENRFSGSYDVAELTFTYTGDADVEIVLGYSQVVTLLADGTTEGDETSSGFTVAVSWALPPSARVRLLLSSVTPVTGMVAGMVIVMASCLLSLP